MNTVNTVTPFPGFSLYTRAYGGILLWGSRYAQVFTGHVVMEQGCSLNNAPGVGGGISRIPELHAPSWAIFGTETDDRSRNTLKKQGILNLVQIGSVIFSLAAIGSRLLRTIREIA